MPVQVVPMEPVHLDRCAALVAGREGGDQAGWRTSLQYGLESEARCSFVALIGDQVAGYATTAILAPRDLDPECLAPNGWYLTGIVVDPSRRRCGVGRGLTATRLNWLRGRTDRVWYVVSGRNRAMIDLHASFGFVRVAGRITFPGTAFTGEGELYVADIGVPG